MGAADVIPGVSGGTVALITGIYERLVGAIGRFDREGWGLVRRRQFAQAWRHIDGAFLAPLIGGIGCGMVAMTWIMDHLMAEPLARQLLLALFFGVIAGSALILLRTIHTRDTLRWSTVIWLGTSAALLAFSISFLQPHGTQPTLPYLFLCGGVAISAMILPGISGAMVLLIMGVYVYLMSIPRSLLHGSDVMLHVAEVGVFGAGCAVGLLGFTRLLRYLLAHRHGATMAALCGFMVGALPNIWPFQRDLTPEVEDIKRKVYAWEAPPWREASTWITFGVMAAAFVMLLAGVAWSKRRGGHSDSR